MHTRVGDLDLMPSMERAEKEDAKVVRVVCSKAHNSAVSRLQLWQWGFRRAGRAACAVQVHAQLHRVVVAQFLRHFHPVYRARTADVAGDVAIRTALCEDSCEVDVVLNDEDCRRICLKS